MRGCDGGCEGGRRAVGGHAGGGAVARRLRFRGVRLWLRHVEGVWWEGLEGGEAGVYSRAGCSERAPGPEGRGRETWTC